MIPIYMISANGNSAVIVAGYWMTREAAEAYRAKLETRDLCQVVEVTPGD